MLKLQQFALSLLTVAISSNIVAVESRSALAATTAAAGTVGGKALFANALPTLESTTKVPILLPASITYDIPLYAYLSNAAGLAYRRGDTAGPVTTGRYLVTVGTTGDCDVKVYCAFATIGGFNMSDPSSPPLVGSQVTLANKAVAFFTAADCVGAHCGNAALAWDFNGYRYLILGKAFPESVLVSLANAFVPPNKLQ